VSEHWVQKWGDHGWAFHDPNGQEATLGVYQRKGEWRSVVQARAGLDTEDIAARVIAKLAARVAELEAAVALAGWLLGLVERACLKAKIEALMDFRVEVGNDTGIDEALSVWLDEYRARLAELEGA